MKIISLEPYMIWSSHEISLVSISVAFFTILKVRHVGGMPERSFELQLRAIYSVKRPLNILWLTHYFIWVGFITVWVFVHDALSFKNWWDAYVLFHISMNSCRGFQETNLWFELSNCTSVCINKTSWGSFLPDIAAWIFLKAKPWFPERKIILNLRG